MVIQLAHSPNPLAMSHGLTKKQSRDMLEREHLVYGYLLDTVAKKAYPFNRDRKPMWPDPVFAAFSTTWWVQPPGVDEVVYLYNDGTKPWESKKNRALHASKRVAIEDEYTVLRVPLCLGV